MSPTQKVQELINGLHEIWKECMKDDPSRINIARIYQHYSTRTQLNLYPGSMIDDLTVVIKKGE